MTQTVRDGNFDVVIVAGSRVQVWPSVGVRVISALGAEMGLTVGIFGGPTMQVIGVLPLPGTGGVVLVQDAQNRVHRIRAKAVVKVTLNPGFPDPFPGWRSPALIPIQTARRLLKEGRNLSWQPGVAILGTGNRALQLGAEFLERGVPSAYCIETNAAEWGAKRYAGWEVHRRRFEMAGGKLLEVKPSRLSQKSSQLWEFRVEDSLGIRLLEVSCVIGAGPYGNSAGFREYPPGSQLFELEQTADPVRADDVQGYVLEEERGRILGVRIVRALCPDTSSNREELEKVFRRARGRLRAATTHHEAPFMPKYQGKWMEGEGAQGIRLFPGVPQTVHKNRLVASLECVEGIVCNLCEKACPESAIRINRSSHPEERSFLIETDCTACGLCLPACPSGVASLVKEEENRSFSKLVLAWRGTQPWKTGEFAMLLNRRGENMGTARISPLPAELQALQETSEKKDDRGNVQLVHLEVPSHLLWEVRGIRRPPSADKRELVSWEMEGETAETLVHISLDGERRLARESIPVSLALFEMGMNRAEDALYCPDGSCELCHVVVDGIKQLACQTKVRKGMAIKLLQVFPQDLAGALSKLCPCENVEVHETLDRVRHGKLRSVEAALAAVPVGCGRCHGQVCMGAFERLLSRNGIDAVGWLDWRFPWRDWVLSPGAN